MLVTGGTTGTGSVVGGTGAGSTGGHSGAGFGADISLTSIWKTKKEFGMGDIALSLDK